MFQDAFRYPIGCEYALRLWVIGHAVFDGAMSMRSKSHCATDPDPDCDDHSVSGHTAKESSEAFETVAAFE